MASERLSDEELLEAAYWNFDIRLGRQGYDLACGTQGERDAFKCAVRDMLAKLRAADLTPEDVEALIFAKHCVRHSLTQMQMSSGGHGLADAARHHDALSALDKLLGRQAR